MSEDQRGGGLGNHPAVIIIGLIAAILAITGFITGKQRLRDYLDERNPGNQESPVGQGQAPVGPSIPAPEPTPGSKEVLYVLGYTYEGLIRIDPDSGAILSRENFQTVNGIGMTWNEALGEFYVLIQNGATVPVVKLGPVRQAGEFSDGIGWNGYSLAIAPDGEAAFGGFMNSSQSYFSAFNARDHSLIKSIPLGSGCCPYVAISHDGSRLYVSANGGVWVYSYPQLELFGGGPMAAGAQGGRLILSPDGSSLYLAQQNWIAKLDTATSTMTGQLRIPGLSSDSRLLISDDGSELWMTSARDAASIFWAPSELSSYEKKSTDDYVIDFCWSQDKRRIYMTAQQNEGTIWSLDKNTKELRQIATGLKMLPTALLSLPAS